MFSNKTAARNDIPWTWNLEKQIGKKSIDN